MKRKDFFVFSQKKKNNELEFVPSKGMVYKPLELTGCCKDLFLDTPTCTVETQTSGTKECYHGCTERLTATVMEKEPEIYIYLDRLLPALTVP
jgi:hypothetical protein